MFVLENIQNVTLTWNAWLFALRTELLSAVCPSGGGEYAKRASRAMNMTNSSCMLSH